MSFNSLILEFQDFLGFHTSVLILALSTDHDIWLSWFKLLSEGFPGGAVVKNLPANAGDTGSSPGPGWSHMLQSN